MKNKKAIGVIIFTLLLVVLIFLPSIQYRLADYYHNNEKYQKALNIYEKLWEDKEGDLGLLYKITMSHIKIKSAEAFTYLGRYRRSIQDDSKIIDILLENEEFFLSGNNPSEVIKFYNTLEHQGKLDQFWEKAYMQDYTFTFKKESLQKVMEYRKEEVVDWFYIEYVYLFRGIDELRELQTKIPKDHWELYTYKMSTKLVDEFQLNYLYSNNKDFFFNELEEYNPDIVKQVASMLGYHHGGGLLDEYLFKYPEYRYAMAYRYLETDKQKSFEVLRTLDSSQYPVEQMIDLLSNHDFDKYPNPFVSDDKIYHLDPIIYKEDGEYLRTNNIHYYDLKDNSRHVSVGGRDIYHRRSLRNFNNNKYFIYWDIVDDDTEMLMKISIFSSNFGVVNSVEHKGIQQYSFSYKWVDNETVYYTINDQGYIYNIKTDTNIKTSFAMDEIGFASVYNGIVFKDTRGKKQFTIPSEKEPYNFSIWKFTEDTIHYSIADESKSTYYTYNINTSEVTEHNVEGEVVDVTENYIYYRYQRGFVYVTARKTHNSTTEEILYIEVN